MAPSTSGMEAGGPVKPRFRSTPPLSGRWFRDARGRGTLGTAKGQEVTGQTHPFYCQCSLFWSRSPLRWRTTEDLINLSVSQLAATNANSIKASTCRGKPERRKLNERFLFFCVSQRRFTSPRDYERAQIANTAVRSGFLLSSLALLLPSSLQTEMAPILSCFHPNHQTSAQI